VLVLVPGDLLLTSGLYFENKTLLANLEFDGDLLIFCQVGLDGC
jgi:hypothetical protein